METVIHYHSKVWDEINTFIQQGHIKLIKSEEII